MTNNNEQKLSTEKHVRPKVQRKSVDTDKNKKSNDHNDNKNNDDVEETRKRMESWMGVGGKKSNKNNGSSSASKHSSNNNGTIVSTKKVTTIISSDIADDAGGAASQEQEQEQKRPVSILRSPRYSTTTIVSQTNDDDQQQKNQMQQQQRTTGQTIVSTNIVESNNNNIKKKISTPKNVICKDFVVERDPTKATKKIKPFRNNKSKSSSSGDVSGNDNDNNNFNSLSIEGYVPTTGINAAAAAAASVGVNFKIDEKNEVDTNDNDNGSNNNNTDDAVDDPLVINSLEGLMKAAGENLPDNKITDDTKMVEADISFSVMTKDQYESKLPTIQQEHEEERQQQLEVFMGRHDIFDDEENNESIEGGVDGNDNDDDDDDDALMELFMGSDVEINNNDDNEERGNSSNPEIRAFTLLWNALTDWMTYETVVWVKGLRDSHNNKIKKDTNNGDDHRNNSTSTIMSMDNEWTPMFDLSDIGASRCAGVLAMIRLYLGRCMDELNQKTEDRRRAEKRLNDIMRTFDYTQENPKLTSSYWKAMACILLDMVLIETRAYPIVDIPFSVKAVGMTLVEFEYLSRKAVLTFDPTP
jgi:hypothetical protein